MNQIRPGSGAPAAVLAGSLAVFPLLDVLGLLARTRHAGELQVVADGVEARLWVEDGDLLDHPSTAAERLFELACLDDAWFTVSSVLPAGRGEHAERERVALEPLLEQVAPHVAEWQSLIKALPFGAVARMSPAMPGSETQIRSDQWRILSLIGTGRPVHEVVDVSDGRPLETLRLIHELAQKELIVVELPPARGRRRTHPAGAAAGEGAEPADAAAGAGAATGAGAASPGGAAAPGEGTVTGGAGVAGRDEVASADATPATQTAQAEGPEAGRAESLPGTGAEDEAGDAGRSSGREPLAAARATAVPLTGRRGGAVLTAVPEPAPAPEAAPAPSGSHRSTAQPPAADSGAPSRGERDVHAAGPDDGPRRTPPRTAASRRPGNHAVAPYMPPPVTPTYWPVAQTVADATTPPSLVAEPEQSA